MPGWHLKCHQRRFARTKSTKIVGVAPQQTQPSWRLQRLRRSTPRFVFVLIKNVPPSVVELFQLFALK